MARTDDDSWDLASSVGATATMVAAARALVTRIDGALISDPYAEPLVRAVGVDVFTRLATGQLEPSAFDIDDEKHGGMDRMVDNMAVRTKFFDDFFVDATAAGVRQVVILASGLDSRAYRLAWPAGTVVYEVDQPEVITFKTQTLADLGAEPTSERRVVGMDLRFDWPAALKEAGFDPTQPTAWSAEGLLGYLPPDAQDRLLDTITGLSAPGSWLATESSPPLDQGDIDETRAKMQAAGDRWREQGYHMDWANLVYLGDRAEPAEYLGERGWRMTGRKINELLTANGYPPLDGDIHFAQLTYLRGTLGGRDPKASASEDRSEARTGASGRRGGQE
ncbi:class I SAM-dependent methyltransferase [Mycolicibacterium moriokaense]|nr:class I SAM-dependent methyltransferase [Mycolicibacterium moriokaense]